MHEEDETPQAPPAQVMVLPQGWEIDADGLCRPLPAASQVPPAPAPVVLPDKRTLQQRLDADAEVQRQRTLTAGAGMMMVYREKKDQAVAVIGLGEAAANALANHGRDEFPTLAASVPAEAPTLYAAAQLVVLRYEQFATLSYGIEKARLDGKKAIAAATTPEAALAAYDAVRWP